MIQKIKILKAIMIIFSLSLTFSANAETVEEIIKGRKALFSKNYSTAVSYTHLRAHETQ